MFLTGSLDTDSIVLQKVGNCLELYVAYPDLTIFSKDFFWNDTTDLSDDNRMKIYTQKERIIIKWMLLETIGMGDMKRLYLSGLYNIWCCIDYFSWRSPVCRTELIKGLARGGYINEIKQQLEKHNTIRLTDTIAEACAGGHTETVEWLLQEYNSCDHKYDSYLFQAAAGGHLALYKKLLLYVTYQDICHSYDHSYKSQNVEMMNYIMNLMIKLRQKEFVVVVKVTDPPYKKIRIGDFCDLSEF